MFVFARHICPCRRDEVSCRSLAYSLDPSRSCTHSRQTSAKSWRPTRSLFENDEKMDPPQSTTVPVIKRSSQACDACKLRKVKCNGQVKCQQCSHLDLKCVYSAPRQRRKPSKRGEVIERYKSVSNGGVDTTQNAALNQVSGNDFFSPQTSQTLPAITSLLSKETFLEGDSPSSSGSHYSAEFYFGFLQDYEASVYPVNPVSRFCAKIPWTELDYGHITDHARSSPSMKLAKQSWRCTQAERHLLLCML